MLNPKMFDLLKGQFVSNLNQDILALSGFCSEDEITEIFEKALEMAVKKSEENSKLVLEGIC